PLCWLRTSGPGRSRRRSSFSSLSVTAALFPCFKESAQRAGVGLVGAQLNGVDVCTAEQFEQFRLCFHLPLGEGGALALVAGVHFNDFAGLGVLQNQPAQRR